MASFLVVTMLSFITLCLGTYVADRVENRHCAACGQTLGQRLRRRADQ